MWHLFLRSYFHNFILPATCLVLCALCSCSAIYFYPHLVFTRILSYAVTQRNRFPVESRSYSRQGKFKNLEEKPCSPTKMKKKRELKRAPPISKVVDACVGRVLVSWGISGSSQRLQRHALPNPRDAQRVITLSSLHLSCSTQFFLTSIIFPILLPKIELEYSWREEQDSSGCDIFCRVLPFFKPRL